jgi:hypothetical protein
VTPSAQSGPQFSQVLRHQLQDLRIDPDTVSEVHHAPAPNRFKTWFADHQDATLTVGLGIGVLVVIFGVVVGVALLLGETSTPARNAPQTTQTSVTSGNMTVPMTGPTYRYIAPGQASLTLHMNLHNPTDAQLQLRAGDLMLVDPHGAAFPPTWHTADGPYADGLANPTHVFMALDPNADTSIDLQFLVLSNGPFTLRYQRQGDAPDSQLPELTLGTATN